MKNLSCGAVWGDEGPFTIVESLDDPLLALVDAGDGAWRAQVAPVTCETRDDGSLTAVAAVRYGDGLFRARFDIAQGLITMAEDQPLAKFSSPPELFASPFRALRSGTLDNLLAGA